jgi:hypothetical protein
VSSHVHHLPMRARHMQEGKAPEYRRNGIYLSSCDRTAHKLSRVPAGFETTRDFISIRCAFSRYLSAVRSLFFLLRTGRYSFDTTVHAPQERLCGKQKRKERGAADLTDGNSTQCC